MSTNFSGVWNANLSASKFLGPVPRAIKITISYSDAELREEILLTQLDGRENRAVFTCSINKGSQGLLNGQAIRSSTRWEGNELLIESWVQLGTREMYFCDCWSLSPDGQTLRMEHRNDDLAGQLTLLERVE